MIGERNESTNSRESADPDGAGMRYVRLVTDASYEAPRYVGYETL